MRKGVEQVMGLNVIYVTETQQYFYKLSECMYLSKWQWIMRHVSSRGWVVRAQNSQAVDQGLRLKQHHPLLQISH